MKKLTILLALLLASFTLLHGETAPKQFPVVSPEGVKKSCCAKKVKPKKCDTKKCDTKKCEKKDCDTKKCDKK